MDNLRQILKSIDGRVVCELTGGGRGAICVLAVSGTKIIEQVETYFSAANKKPLSHQATLRPVYGRWQTEDLIVCIHDEDFVEVHCHGGNIARQRIIRDLKSEEFQVLTWGEIATSASLPPVPVGSACMAALLQLPHATTRKTAAVLTWQSQGALDDAFSEIQTLIDSSKVESAVEKIQQLLSLESLGSHLAKPWTVAIAGAPNVGKSSLINQMVGFGRAIVFDQPGTTRDLVAVATAIDGWPFQLIDTAGIRDSSDEIERTGIRLAHQAVDDADLTIELRDASDPATATITSNSPERTLVVFNKCDLIRDEQTRDMDGIKISALTGSGVRDLLEAIRRKVIPVEPSYNSPVPFTSEQVEWLRRTLEQLQASPKL